MSKERDWETNAALYELKVGGETFIKTEYANSLIEFLKCLKANFIWCTIDGYTYIEQLF